MFQLGENQNGENQNGSDYAAALQYGGLLTLCCYQMGAHLPLNGSIASATFDLIIMVVVIMMCRWWQKLMGKHFLFLNIPKYPWDGNIGRSNFVQIFFG